ncbi:hypothetical protein GCM10022243_16380 [Saccharothrix violaceirubra]|uniref:Uncharacterized protein n=1 Tax=Saccharothrix violaceirubra TaxID=413306 RepID=A0A7W7T6V8_9PSEU|nr:hypothetical protein [Saccharothrix violaceirubra]MBB4967672.1 hypothetical protein [Saccharothrix violaceirubra]
MSRTAHPRTVEGSRPWRSIVVVDLRYDHACFAEARGERPRPRLIRRRVAVHRFPRGRNDSDVRDRAQVQERRARRRLRRELYLARVAGLEDVVPARHRRDALYHG